MKILKIYHGCALGISTLIYHHEKEGGNPRSQACVDRFKGALEVSVLDDLGYMGMLLHTIYHDAFFTPVSSPLFANERNIIRDMWNFL